MNLSGADPLNRSVLLLSDDNKLIQNVRHVLKDKDATLHVEKDLQRIWDITREVQPDVIINALLDEDLIEQLHSANWPDVFMQDQNYALLNFAALTMEQLATDSILYFLDTIPILNAVENAASSFTVRRGKATLKPAFRRSKRLATKASEARASLLNAKEALQALAGYDEDANVVGNRCVVPLSNEVLQTIQGTLDASLGLVNLPIKGQQAVSPMRRMISALRDIEKVIKQVEKTATAGVKAAGVLTVLAAAIAVAALKLMALVATLGLG